MEDILILVDENDNPIGYGTKMDVHRKEQLHRAFSLFIYDKSKKQVLLHNRALGKYHSGGLWTNSCCSHPRKDEELVESVIRRTKEELGFDIEPYKNKLKELGKFHYYKKFDDCAENEIDHVFLLGIDCQPDLKVNSDEIAEIQWFGLEEIFQSLEDNPDKFTAWFSKAFEYFMAEISR